MTTVAARVVAGLSTERLQQIDSHLERRYLDAGKIAGALTLVARRGEIAHLSSLGLMDAERGKPMQDDTIFRIYSMSKPITSVALMSLYEEGRFQLDQPVHDFIPAWEGLGVWQSGAHPAFVTRHPERAMTVRDLLSHQSGLTYSFHQRHPIDAAYRELGHDVRAPPESCWRTVRSVWIAEKGPEARRLFDGEHGAPRLGAQVVLEGAGKSVGVAVEATAQLGIAAQDALEAQLLHQQSGQPQAVGVGARQLVALGGGERAGPILQSSARPAMSMAMATSTTSLATYSSLTTVVRARQEHSGGWSLG